MQKTKLSYPADFLYCTKKLFTVVLCTVMQKVKLSYLANPWAYTIKHFVVVLLAVYVKKLS
jgi:hypothetical protein